MSIRDPASWRVSVLLTGSICSGGDWRRVARESIDAGADCIQLREKLLDDAELLRRAEELRDLSRGRCALVVNDRPDIALLAEADGVHLGQGDLPCRRVREMAGERLVIGISTSNLDEAKRAFDDGADACGVGPMFPTTTKQKDRLAGPAYLREFIAWGRLPHLAIGGITPQNIDELVEVGCRGIAVSSAVCGAADPGEVVRVLRERLLASAPIR